MNLILWLISLLIISGYLLYIVWRFGVQASVSDTYYKIKHKPVFSFVLIFTAFPLIILSSTGLMFFAGAALMFVAVSPAFMKHSLEKKVHTYSAFIAILFTILSIIINFKMWWMVLPLITFSLIITLKVIKINNRIWWIEIVAFGQMYLTLFISKVI